jgi:hypothetical protein
MTKHIALLGALLTAVACGGTTDNGNGPFDGGASSGGGTSSGAAGKSSSGSSGTSAGASQGGAGSSSGSTGSSGATHGGASSGGAVNGGVANGGVANGGVPNGGVANGGVSNGGVSSGGSPSVDPRCPATTPSGACNDEGLKCEYNPRNGCLCANSPSVVTFCQQVDQSCTGPIREGSGGFAAKIAVPAHQRCTCSADKWTCVLGI